MTPEAIAAWGLADATRPSTSAPPAAIELSQALLGVLDQQRLTGLAVAAIAAGDFVLDPPGVDQIAGRDERWQGHALRMERLLLSLHRAFDDAGIEHLVLKGPALANTIYDNPAHRPFGDIDVLVRGADLSQARSVLASDLGGEEPLPELRPGFDERFAKDVLVRVGEVEIDLHRTIAPGPFGLRLPADELFDHQQPFALGSHQLATFDPCATFLQVCCNAALGDVPPRLLSLRDVAQAAGADGFDLDRAVTLAARWGLGPVVQHAVTKTWATLDLAPDAVSAWAESYQASGIDRRLLAASVSTDRSYTRQLAALWAVPGLRAKLRYAHAIVAPQPSYLEARGWDQRSHLKRAVRRLGAARSSKA